MKPKTSRSQWYLNWLERMLGRLPNGALNSRPGGPPRFPARLRFSFDLAPLLSNFSRYVLLLLGNKSPLSFALNLFEKAVDLKLKVVEIFGRTLALFIGDFEASSMLGRLAHCLKHLARPWIDLKAASRELDCNLQVSEFPAENSDHLTSNSGHLVRWSAKLLHKECCPDHSSCNPSFRLVEKAAGRISLLQKFQKLHFCPIRF